MLYNQTIHLHLYKLSHFKSCIQYDPTEGEEGIWESGGIWAWAVTHVHTHIYIYIFFNYQDKSSFKMCSNRMWSIRKWAEGCGGHGGYHLVCTVCVWKGVCWCMGETETEKHISNTHILYIHHKVSQLFCCINLVQNILILLEASWIFYFRFWDVVFHSTLLCLFSVHSIVSFIPWAWRKLLELKRSEEHTSELQSR